MHRIKTGCETKGRLAARGGILWDEVEVRERDQARVASLRARRGLAFRLLLGFVLVGPGILVMIADNDAGGVMTYAETGAMYGVGFFVPALALSGVIAYVVQEMTVRLGAVTRRGHAEMIWGRYGPFWGLFSLLDLGIANTLTLVTEFIGITLGLRVFGVPRTVGVAAALLLDALVLLFLRYYTWERVSLWIAAGNLVFIPLAVMAHPHWGSVASAFYNWRIPGGATPAFLFVILANFGTTVAPWMLFFQQSAVVDKGLTSRDIRHGQLDTAIGTVLMVAVALAILVATATVARGGAGGVGSFGVGRILAIFGRRIGPAGEDLFALGLVEAGVISLIALTASTSWAAGEAFGWSRSVNAPPSRAWRFYLPGLLSAALAASATLIPEIPLGFLNMTVQVIASIFMPAAMFFLLLLLNDREVMGEYVNRPWQNAAAFGIVGLLVVLNALYGFSVILARPL